MTSLVLHSALASALHVLGLGVGLGSVYARGQVLSGPLDEGAMRRAFSADNYWAVAALLWLGSGLWRVFGNVAKTSAYYLHNGVFLTKFGLFCVVILLELYPMVTLIRWRRALAKGQPVDTSAAPTLALISKLEVALLLVIVCLATLMARGVGQF